MRVIAGHLKGRPLKTSSGLQLRPTADRVKEALFSILGAQVRGARVLDLYAGTGSLGIEALSRGAVAVTFVERHPPTVQILRENLQGCGVLGLADIQACRVESFLVRKRPRPVPYHILLADPPYQQLAEVEAWGAYLPSGLVAEGGVAAVEHARKNPPPRRLGSLGLLRTYTYGDTALSIYRPQVPEAAP